MNHPKRFFKVVAVALAATLLTAACSTISGGKKADYKKARTTESLEVPPDLTATSIKEAPDLPSAAGTSLSEMNRSAPAAGTLSNDDMVAGLKATRSGCSSGPRPHRSGRRYGSSGCSRGS